MGRRFTFFGKCLRFCLVVCGFDGCLLVNALGTTRPMSCGRVWRILPRRIRVLRSVDLKTSYKRPKRQKGTFLLFRRPKWQNGTFDENGTF